MIAMFAVVVVAVLVIGAVGMLDEPKPEVGDIVRVQGDSRLWRVVSIDGERVALHDLARPRSKDVTAPADLVVIHEPYPAAPPNA